jgi:hypothetical protein
MIKVRVAAVVVITAALVILSLKTREAPIGVLGTDHYTEVSPRDGLDQVEIDFTGLALDHKILSSSDFESEISHDPLLVAARSCFERPHELYIQAIVFDAEQLLERGQPEEAAAAMEIADSFGNCEGVSWVDGARLLSIYEYHAARGNSRARLAFAKYLVVFANIFENEEGAMEIVRGRASAAMGWMELEARRGEPDAFVWITRQSTMASPDLIYEEDVVRYGTYSVAGSVLNAGVSFEFAMRRAEQGLRMKGASDEEIAVKISIIREAARAIIEQAAESEVE